MKSINISEKYKEIKKDLYYIKINYGEINDFCGWCECRRFEKLLDNPNKKTAFEILKEKMSYYFEIGAESGCESQSGMFPKSLPLEDKRLQEIKEKWSL